LFTVKEANVTYNYSMGYQYFNKEMTMDVYLSNLAAEVADNRLNTFRSSLPENNDRIRKT